jgi:hypothetical protein
MGGGCQLRFGILGLSSARSFFLTIKLGQACQLPFQGLYRTVSPSKNLLHLDSFLGALHSSSLARYFRIPILSVYGG